MEDFAAAEPPGSTNWLLYKCWSSLSLGGRIPLAVDVLTDNTNTMRLDGQTTLVDVEDPNPWNFVFMHHWHTPYARLGTELTDTRVSQYPCLMHAKALMSEYCVARESAAPVYHEIEQMIFGISRHYRRIILPLADTNSSVTKLLVGVRSIRPPYEVTPSSGMMLVN